jgi:hypothetical protein
MPESMRDLCERKEEVWERNGRPNFDRQSDFRVIAGFFNMPQSCRRGTDGFTSPPKEGMLWIFSPEKSDGFGPLYFTLTGTSCCDTCRGTHMSGSFLCLDLVKVELNL